MDAINFNFSCNNVKGIQRSKKRLVIQIFQKIVFYSYKKRIPQRTKLSGMTNLTVIYTFHIVNQIGVES